MREVMVGVENIMSTYSLVNEGNVTFLLLYPRQRQTR
jgi:hypothetical protein